MFRSLNFSGMESRRVISEPTAASLAYGLHKKKGVEHIIVVDLGKYHSKVSYNSMDFFFF